MRCELPVGVVSRVSLRWQLTALYVLVLLTVTFAAKGISAALSARSARRAVPFLLISPFPSVRTWLRVQKLRPGEAGRVILRGAAFLLAGSAIYLWFPSAISRPGLSWAVRAYLSVVPFWLATEAVGCIVQL